MLPATALGTDSYQVKAVLECPGSAGNSGGLDVVGGHAAEQQVAERLPGPGRRFAGGESLGMGNFSFLFETPDGFLRYLKQVVRS